MAEPFENEKVDGVSELTKTETEKASSQPQEQVINHKTRVKFTYSSFQRRNVDKCIVRCLTTLRKQVEASIFQEFDRKQIDREKYYEISNALDEMNGVEKKSGAKKDYSTIINCMICNPAHRIVLKNCLEQKRRIINEKLSQKVKGESQKIYLDTFDDYLNYINSL